MEMGVIRKDYSPAFPEGKPVFCSAIMKRNLYRILGVRQDADLAKIKRAYRQAAKRYHPDISPGTAKQFRDAEEAYDILSDPKKKAIYDRENPRELPVRMSNFEATPPSRPPYDSFFLDFNDPWAEHIAESFVNSRRRLKGLAAEIILTPQEALQGGEIALPVQFEILCERCDGSGRFAGLICDKCLGSGKIGREVVIHLQIPAGLRNGLVERIPLWNSRYQEVYLNLTFLINRH